MTRTPRRMERRTPVWQAPDDIMELFPDVSGNTLNGLGEVAARAVSAPMWRNPAAIAHGRVQDHITAEYVGHPELGQGMRSGPRYQPVPLAENQVDHDPIEWATLVRQFVAASEFPASKVGIIGFRQEWAFSDAKIDAKWLILLADVMQYDDLATAPDWPAAREVHRSYNRGTTTARNLADWIRSQGHEAIGHGGPGAGPVLLIPPAIEVGFGELGKHGSLIDEDMGSGFRLSAVLTDLPLEADKKPKPLYVDPFCEGCRVCTDACPPNAISPDKQLVRGVDKWYIDFDKCLPYFAVSFGCAACIAVCPWTKPDRAPRLAEIMRRKHGDGQVATG